MPEDSELIQLPYFKYEKKGPLAGNSRRSNNSTLVIIHQLDQQIGVRTLKELAFVLLGYESKNNACGVSSTGNRGSIQRNQEMMAEIIRISGFSETMLHDLKEWCASKIISVENSKVSLLKSSALPLNQPETTTNHNKANTSNNSVSDGKAGRTSSNTGSSRGDSNTMLSASAPSFKSIQEQQQQQASKQQSLLQGNSSLKMLAPCLPLQMGNTSDSGTTVPDSKDGPMDNSVQVANRFVVDITVSNHVSANLQKNGSTSSDGSRRSAGVRNSWWIVIGSTDSNDLFAMKRVIINSVAAPYDRSNERNLQSFSVQFSVPSTHLRTADVSLFLLSEAYLGLDVIQTLSLPRSLEMNR